MGLYFKSRQKPASEVDMKKFLIIAKVNGNMMQYEKYATCKRNAKKEFLDTMFWTSSADVEIVDIVNL